MQAAAMNPSFLDKSDVDEATLAKEKEILLVQALEENKNAAKPKPEQIIHKMVEEMCIRDRDSRNRRSLVPPYRS